MPQLAGIVNEDLTEGWNHVWAWTLATDMLHAARDQLETARASLAAVWTAEKSPAAQEFFNFVEAVSESMAATAEAASANRSAMQQVLDSQAATQTAVNELHGSWQSWSHDTLDPADAQSVMTDLNARAAAHMTAADQVLTDATQALVVPHLFDPGKVIYRLQLLPGTDNAPSGSGGANSSGGWMPGEPGPAGGFPIPTLPGESTPGGTDGGIGGAGRGIPISVGGTAPGRRGGGSPGDRLGPNENTPGSIPPGSAPGEPEVSYPSTGLVGAYPSQASSQSASPRRGTSVGALAGDHWQPPLGSPGTVRSSAAGDVGYVDGSPVPSSRALSAPSMSGRSSAEAGSTNGLLPTAMLGGSSWGTARGGRRNAQSAPWETPTGVPAILVPAIESDAHDPGPGVIGIDL